MLRSWKCDENYLTEQTSSQETQHKIKPKIAYLACPASKYPIYQKINEFLKNLPTLLTIPPGQPFRVKFIFDNNNGSKTFDKDNVFIVKWFCLLG